jgi:hypothetical protein
MNKAVASGLTQKLGEHQHEERARTAKRCTVSSRGRKPTVGGPMKRSPTPLGVILTVRCLQGRMLLGPFPSVDFTHG